MTKTWVLFFALGASGCGDGTLSSSELDAGTSAAADSARFDSRGSDSARADVETDGSLDAVAEAPIDAGPPAPVIRNSDGSFVVRDESGAEFALCGCTEDAVHTSLGPRFWAVAGRQSQLFFDNIVENEGTNYRWTTHAAPVGETLGGETLEDRFQFTPESAGTTNLFVVAWDPASGEPVGVAVTEVIVSAADAGASGSVLFLGDSTTAAGVYVDELLNRYDEDVSEFVSAGTVGSGRNRHEGRGGWTIADYATDRRGAGANPFFNAGGFDYAYYLSSTGITAPDYFLVHLGINDVFSGTTESLPGRMATMLERLDVILASVQTVAPDTQLAVALTIVPCATEAGFFANYMGMYTRAPYKIRIVEWVKQVIAHYQDRSDVALVPLNANLDSWLGFPNEPDGSGGIMHTNGVHPNREGYGQMAEMIYAWLKSN